MEPEALKHPVTMSATINSRPQPALAPEPFQDSRMRREFETMAAMVRIYCRSRHGVITPCQECQDFLDYAGARLERCRFGPDKPTCQSCPVHCYQKTRRDMARTIMRHSGPRMLWKHPVLAVRHWVDGWTRRVKSGGRE